jgi:hypothetical protein
MAVQDKISLATAQAQAAELRGDMHHSRVRVLATLLVSTFLLLFWVEFLLRSGVMHFGAVRFWSLVLIPPAMNAVCWGLWGAFGYLTLLLPKRFYRAEADNLEDNRGARVILDEYQYAVFSLRRQRKFEVYVNVFTALQFVMMGATTAYSLFVGVRSLE